MGQRGWRTIRALAAFAAAFSAAAAEDRPASDEIIAGLKTYEQSQGLAKTGNFRNSSAKVAAEYRCYFTGKLKLPASYDGLRLRETNGSRCRVDEKKYDVFFYPVEAVATGHAPVTSGLANASVERQLMVVPHEDLHDSRQVAKLDAAVGEAAATLIGFRMAAGFARERFGAESGTYRNLSREPELFLAKAKIVNRYWEELAALYAAVRARRTKPKDALAAKERAFTRLRQECTALAPRPVSFNACPAAINNAGLAFDATYTRYYPLVYELYRLQGDDFRLTLDTLSQTMRSRHMADAEAERALRGAIDRLRSTAPGTAVRAQQP